MVLYKKLLATPPRKKKNMYVASKLLCKQLLKNTYESKKFSKLMKSGMKYLMMNFFFIGLQKLTLIIMLSNSAVCFVLSIQFFKKEECMQFQLVTQLLILKSF